MTNNKKKRIERSEKKTPESIAKAPSDPRTLAVNGGGAVKTPRPTGSGARLLILGLILLNVGCFVPTEKLCTIDNLLDLRLQPTWYFAAAPLLIVLASFWARVYRNGSNDARGRRRTLRSLAATPLCAWSLFAVALLFRAAFDVKTYNYGSTVVVHSLRSYDYLLHFPRGYADFTGKRPLLVFLHGAGESGKDVTVLKDKDVFYYANGTIAPDDFPFIVVSPIASEHGGWKPQDVKAFIDDFLADKRFRYRIDETRVYLTGYSMGGFGTFHTAAAYPERFAAIAPLAGGCEPEAASQLQTVPTRAFHGDADPIVPIERSREIVEAMQKENCADVSLTTLKGYEHNICEPVYTNAQLYRWMLSRSKPRPEHAKRAP